MNKHLLKDEVYLYKIAEACHEMNRTHCALGGDDSQPEWDEAPKWQRDSAMLGVRFVLANPDAGDDASHNSWSKQKLEEGWKYGPVKNPETREHPCLVPFEQLPLHDQIKDRLFRVTVLTMARLYKTEGMSFGEAVDRMNAGFKVAREIWGGYWKIEMLQIVDHRIGAQDVYNDMIVAHLKEGGIAPAAPYQADLLATDYKIVD